MQMLPFMLHLLLRCVLQPWDMRQSLLFVGCTLFFRVIRVNQDSLDPQAQLESQV